MTERDIHFTCETFIVHDNKVLLRMHPKLGMWCSIGGHIDPGEDPNEAALREIREETGLKVQLWDGRKEFTVDEEESSFKNLIPPIGLNRHVTNNGHEHVTLVYLASSDTNVVTPETAGEELRWVTADELKHMDLMENIREYAGGALRILGS